jgi:hypothetical protein
MTGLILATEALQNNTKGHDDQKPTHHVTWESIHSSLKVTGWQGKKRETTALAKSQRRQVALPYGAFHIWHVVR